MKRSVLLCVLLVTGATLAMSQDTNPHRRLMERAHPTPVVPSDYNHLPIMVPMLVEKEYPSMFLNASMVIPETDPLPAQNESSIAVNPRNPRNLIGSAVDYRGSSSTWAYYSTDAGNTWQNVTLGLARPGWASSNDPSVCFDHNGKGYLCYGGFKREGNVQFGENGVFVSSTTDGGATWGMKHTAVIIHTGAQTADSSFEDKYYVHADTVASSPYRGHLYIPWKRVVNRDSSTQIVISKSTDEGVSWSVPVAVSDRFPQTSEAPTFGQSFPLARTGPDGSVHLVWNSGTESSIRYARSSNGGQLWTAPRKIQTYSPFGIKSTINGQTNSRVKVVVRAECYPTLAVDNTGGQRNGWLYLTWAADNYPNVYFSRSTDNGDTWSPATIVHSDTTNDQFWSWITLDPTSGEIAIMYSDSRDDASNILVNTYVSWSSDGGTTWIDRRVGNDVNDIRRNPFAGNTFSGDYSGCDFYNGIVYPSWVDMRNTYINLADNDVYTAVVNTRAPQAPSTFTASTIPTRPTEIDLQWSAVNQRSFGQPLTASETSFVLRRDSVVIATLPIATLTYTDKNLTKYRLYNYTLQVVSGPDSSALRMASAYAGGSRELSPPVLVRAQGNTEVAPMDVEVQLPRFRLDGVNSIVNIARLETSASEFTFPLSLATSDTGKGIIHRIEPAEKGWYRIRARVLDTDGNGSPYSDSIWAFTGPLEQQEEPFNTEPRYHRVHGPWGLSSSFYRSAPSSYSYSPNGPYLSNRRDTVVLFPIRPAVPTSGYWNLNIIFSVAAFIDPSDTMFFEVSRTGVKGAYETMAWWNASKDARWLDTTKGDDAWRTQNITMGSVSGADTLYPRLRFRSNAARQSDGFYMDDVMYDIVNSIAESKPSTVSSIAPFPASMHVNISLGSDAPITTIEAYDATGVSHTISWVQSGYTVVADVRDFASGFYTLRLTQTNRILSAQIMILR